MKDGSRHAGGKEALVWGLANPSADGPAPRQSWAQVERVLEQIGLDQQMKTFGQWDAWAAGRRGLNK